MRAAPCENAHFREYFYVGGEYVDDGTGHHILQGQMYVERLRPVNGCRQQYSLILIHGGGQTGTNWLNTPDGRQGWASWFLDHGYTVYLVDQTERGRSPANSPQYSISAEKIEQNFTAAAKFMLWPEAALHTQWPGSGLHNSPIFDNYYASVVPSVTSSTCQETTMRAAGPALLDRIGEPCILIGHSRGGTASLHIADTRPNLIKAVILLEPSGPPFRKTAGLATEYDYGLTGVSLTYAPPVTQPGDLKTKTLEPPANKPSLKACTLQADDSVRELINLAPLPMLVVTGQASYHAAFDYATVEFLKQAGVKNVEHCYLAENGIKGNGHMMFMEKNNLEIAALLECWIAELVAADCDTKN